MQPDHLAPLPFELLPPIISNLDSLTLLCCREVNSCIKACVDSLPEYEAYQTKFKAIIQKYEEGQKPRQGRVFGLARAAELFTVVRDGAVIDYELFFDILLNYPQARAIGFARRERRG